MQVEVKLRLSQVELVLFEQRVDSDALGEHLFGVPAVGPEYHQPKAHFKFESGVHALDSPELFPVDPVGRPLE